MGTEGNQEGRRADFVFDAGGLIAFERGDQRVRALAEQSDAFEISIAIPASALAQVWRGGSRSASLARLISSSASDSLDESRAKEIGKRLASRDKADIADAHVVCCALDHNAAVITSDRADIEALVEPTEKLVLVSV
jgi:hypothetical protein